MMLTELLIGAFCTSLLSERAQPASNRQGDAGQVRAHIHHRRRLNQQPRLKIIPPDQNNLRSSQRYGRLLKTPKKRPTDNSHAYRSKAKEINPHLMRVLNNRRLVAVKLPKDQMLTQKLATLSLPLVVVPVGGFLSAPAMVGLGLGVYLYTALPLVISDLYTALIKEQRISMVALECVLFVIMLSTGHYFAAVLGAALYLLSKKLVLKTENHSRQSLINTFDQQHQSAWQKIDDLLIETPVEKLNRGDLIVVSAGEIIPVDGVVHAGMASVDQSALTGESQPVDCDPQQKVFAATVVLTGQLEIAVESAGTETIAAQINQILLKTADFTSTMHSRGEYIADRTAFPTLIAGGLSAVAGFTPIRSASLMNANFGYNMRILAPISMLNHLGYGAKNGVLIKDGRALELIEQVDTVVFDKTGTLTEERPTLADIHLYGDYSADELLRYAAIAEQRQGHPIAQAIIAAAAASGHQTLPSTDAVAYRIGYGLTAQYQDKVVQLGSRRFMASESIAIPFEANALFSACEERGVTLVMMAIDGELVGAFELHATIRPEAQLIIEHLRQAGIGHIYIITGDHDSAARYIAQQLNIDGYFANVLPQEKANHIKQLQQAGRTVCYVGDGINDAIALKQSHVSISLAGASTVATDTAAIILMDGNLAKLPLIFSLVNSFSTSIKRSFYSTMVPGFICVVGVIGLHFGIVSTILLNQAGLMVGIANASLKQKSWKAGPVNQRWQGA